MQEGVPESREPAAVEGAVLVLADLFFASRVRAAGSAAGVTVSAFAQPDRLLRAARSARPALVIADLELRGCDVPALIREIVQDSQLQDVPVVGFASHMNAQAIAAGRAAGARRVLARSAFVQALPGLLRR